MSDLRDTVRCMAPSDGKHVFISYVREDKAEVDGLCAVLEAAGIPYWRDRKDLGPGDAWKAQIREAIRGGSLVFLACFSDNSRAKDKSYMNEELSLAVEEYRLRPPGKTWLIPVRFDAGEVPEWDLGAGRVLSDLNFSDLFGGDHMAHVASLVTTINRLLGEKRPDAATTLAAVEQAASASRTDMMKRLTKEMLLEPSRRIELDDLVSQEVQRVLGVLQDDAKFSGPLGGTNEDQVVRLAEQATELFHLVEPFCASLHVAVRWGSPEILAPWSNGLRSFVTVANKVQGGNAALLDLRNIPGMVAVFTAGITAVSTGTWPNLKALLVDQLVKDKHEASRSMLLLEATDPFTPFASTNDIVPNTLARAAVQEKDFIEAYKDFVERKDGRYFTPVAEWIFQLNRPTFADQWPDEDTFAAEMDRAEIVLGLLSQDAALTRAGLEQRGWARSRWFGRSLWRHRHRSGSPVADLGEELENQGLQWPPLRAGLFGGDPSRAKAAIEAYGEDFNRWSRNLH